MLKNPPDDPATPSRFGLLLLCLVVVQLFIHARIIDAPQIQFRKAMHEQFLAGVLEAPYQYRVLSFVGPESLRRCGFSFLWAYLVWRGICLFVTLMLLFHFLRRYLPDAFVLCVLTYACAVLPLSYLSDVMQESDFANWAFYVGGYLLIRARQDRWLFLLLAVAMLNRETPLLLPFVWLFYRWDELPLSKVLGMFAGYLLIACMIYVGLRFFLPAYVYDPKGLIYQGTNSLNLYGYLFFLIWFGPFIDPMIKGWRERPKFLQRSLLFIPFYVAFHWIVGNTEEVRYFLPILSLALAFPPGHRPPRVSDDEPHGLSRGTPRWIAQNPLAICGLLLALFTVSALGFRRELSRRQTFRTTTPAELAHWHLTRAMIYSRNGLQGQALQEARQAQEADPQNSAASSQPNRVIIPKRTPFRP